MDYKLLCKISAFAAVLVGVFLILGGYGHLEAIIAGIRSQGEQPGMAFLPRMATGGVLLIPGLFNIAASPWIWLGKSQALLLSLVLTLASFLYFVYLLVVGVPDHPIAAFAVIVGAYLALLIFTRSRIGK